MKEKKKKKKETGKEILGKSHNREYRLWKAVFEVLQNRVFSMLLRDQINEDFKVTIELNTMEIDEPAKNCLHVAMGAKT